MKKRETAEKTFKVLGHGDKLHSSDLFQKSSGQLVKCPPQVVGVVLKQGISTLWVRPINKTV
ncbi:MAG: hypothetical protein A3G47_02040 [Candidatus Zambryskibacteria bacterium RIFCSPLOWO2_12_FULL_39_45]|uniref:Uncharacterized protein n=3 Tax=Candidatus Zambryskiibacteriota TaxID=1817925 RepID=A0A1G2T9P9_9BACT|nr:MAG: hypothetical protein A2W58_01905 [Candidatus Zambryskibacteria bacterium RIFCSPHIGHO2_02_38_10.5]OHA95368.1 MAG: hypothetical protein A3C63_01175 [Candidatus Zambryskibacteria bacterium RIFCSPHIGHO2_02_FULL_39_82]OHA97224.1 MAG: hypothetical protein A3E32_01060 [Candidatus Zambryskibacteria bacterium RIFCSPHIGHO2_12_FULL_38_37]OHB07387.1 MAG: hypothetical protein A2W64_00505 [Candidatus Zambryskibacteria bacterium RIFCSPLOWO2_02_39_10]OHB09418.1 MAG: hypothetical protein A3I21_01715 [Ca